MPEKKLPKKLTIITTKVFISANKTKKFLVWQKKMAEKIASFPGFIGINLVSPNPSEPNA